MALGALPRRTLHHRLLGVLICSHIAAAGIVLWREAGGMQVLELALYDRLVVATAGSQPAPQVVLVTADEDDIARYGWPLNDQLLAQVLERLTAWKAKAIGVDIYRDRPLPPGSAALDDLLRRYGNVLWVFKLPDETNQGIAAPAVLDHSGRTVLADIVTDAGGVVRRGLLMAADPRNGRNVRTLGLALAERMTGARLRPLGDDVGFGQARIPLLQGRGGPYAEVDAAGYQTLLDFHGGVDRFTRISISALLGGDGAAAAIDGNAVIIGTTALSVHDSFATPFSTGSGDTRPQVGVTLHAVLADQLMRGWRGAAVGRVPTAWGLDRALIWLCALIGGVLSLLVSMTWLFGLVLVGCVGAIAATTTMAFAAGILLPGLPCALGLIAAAAASKAALHAAGQRERSRLQRSFEHYLDPRIIRDILATETLPSFGGEHREISVLFTDIAGFTTFSETTPVDTVASLLHAYFDGVCGAAMRYGGLVSEFTGDGVLCLFGAPQRQPDHADRAVSAALAIDSFAEAFSAAEQARGNRFGATRIGVHTGIALVGNIGTSTRLRYSAVGDLLNTASRIEGLNKRIGSRICVTSATVAKCDRHRFQIVGEFVVKGRSGAITVHAPLAAGDEAELIARYEAAYAALRVGDAEAPALFDRLAHDWPGNAATAFHARRIAAGEAGVHFVMEKK